MKSLGVAALLITIGLTAGCPQTGQFLAPNGGFSADAPKSGEGPGDDSDETSTPPASAPEAVSKGLEMGDTGGGPAAGSEKFRMFAGGPLRPIEPKSDEANIEIISYLDARLRYGPKYSQILPESPPRPFFLTKSGGPVALNFLLELAFAGEKPDGTPDIWWSPAGIPADVENAEGGVVRLVHQPAGTAGAFYCDAQWTNPDPAGTNLSFPPLALGPGKVSFYQYQKVEKDAANNLIFLKPLDFHPCGGLVPVTSGDPAQPFPPVAGPLMVHPLGSYILSSFQQLTTPIIFP